MIRAFLDRIVERRELRYWSRQRVAVATADPDTATTIARRAARVADRAGRCHHEATARLTALTNPPDLPPRCDWSHRPDAWTSPLPDPVHAPAQTGTAIDHALSLHHDCTTGEICLTQIRGERAPFSIVAEIYGFSGTYLSFAIALPDNAARELTRNDVVRLDLALQSEAPVRAYARFNLRHGPNTEKVVREIDRRMVVSSAEFDLFYTEMEGMDVSGAWVDVIFENPAMNRLILSDVVLSRRKRANV